MMDQANEEKEDTRGIRQEQEQEQNPEEKKAQDDQKDTADQQKQPAYLRFPLPPRPANNPGQLIRLHPLTKQWYSVEQSHPVEIPKRPLDPPLPVLHPEVELVRAQKHDELRRQMEELCATQGVPKGSPQGLFERWLWTQLCIQPEEADPLIPYSATHVEPRFEQELADFDVSQDACRVILQQMATISRQFCLEIRAKAAELMTSQDTQQQQQADVLHGAQFPPIEVAKHPDRRDAVQVKFQSTTLDLNEDHYGKLKRNYRKDTREHEAEFRNDLFCLLLRYFTLGGDAYQAACPPFVFRHFRYEFGVQQECFASPLNCYFSKLCSAFPDTDVAFGSVGSFFQFTPDEGSFEANPPFTEVTMQKMIEHMDFLLANTTKPLSFLVVVPRWDDAASPMWKMLCTSPFFVRRVDVPKRNHQYCKGYQHNLASKFWIASHETCVFFLQNNAGREKYNVTDSFCDKLLAVWSMNNNSRNGSGGRGSGRRENRNNNRHRNVEPRDSRDYQRRRYGDHRDNERRGRDNRNWRNHYDRRGDDRQDRRRGDSRDSREDRRRNDRDDARRSDQRDFPARYSRDQQRERRAPRR